MPSPNRLTLLSPLQDGASAKQHIALLNGMGFQAEHRLHENTIAVTTYRENEALARSSMGRLFGTVIQEVKDQPSEERPWLHVQPITNVEE